LFFQCSPCEIDKTVISWGKSVKSVSEIMVLGEK